MQSVGNLQSFHWQRILLEHTVTIGRDRDQTKEYCCPGVKSSSVSVLGRCGRNIMIVLASKSKVSAVMKYLLKMRQQMQAAVPSSWRNSLTVSTVVERRRSRNLATELR